MKYTWLIILLFLSHTVYGQDTPLHSKSMSQDSNFYRQKYAIGLSPLAELNQYPAIQLSHHIGLLKWLNINIETGYIHDNPRDIRNLKGYRIRGELEIILERWHDIAYTMNFFVNHRYTEQNNQFIIFHEEDYKETVKYVAISNLLGYGLSTGFIYDISEKINLNFSFGIGIGKLTVLVDPDLVIPPQRIDFSSRFTLPGVYNYPIIYTNLNFSYNLVFYK